MSKPTSNEVPDSLGDFEILRELGRGGMGVVYEARQRSLKRKVALKVLSSGLGLTSRAVLRFRREAEAAGTLHHTNIVPIYATGEDKGIHYYAMELVDGPSLDRVIRQLRSGEERAPAAGSVETTDGSSGDEELDPWVCETIAYKRKPAAGNSTSTDRVSASGTSSSISSGTAYFDTVARMIAEVADALDHAHTNGVIHRDIKPSNLLLSPDGRLSVTDFGLARILEQPGMTISGEFVGSPLYMSPEQITAGRAPLDHRTDIYSLGASLYELLTFEPPFPGSRRDQVIARIIHKEPTPPRRKVKKIPVDLETICLKAMDKDPDRRYQTASQMAEDLRRYVNRFAISAKRVGVVGLTVKWVRRHPALAACMVVALVAVGVAGIAGYSAHRSRVQIRQMELEEAKENALLAAISGDFDAAEGHILEAEQAKASLGWVRMLRGQIALHRGDYDKAVEHLDQAVTLLPDNTAAYAMLTIAHFEAGDEDLYFTMLERLEQRPLVDFQDYLFTGLAQSWGHPAQSLTNLDIARELRPASQIALLIRARARWLYAMDVADLDVAEGAIADANAFRQSWPDNPAAIADHLNANLVAANICRRTDEEDRIEGFLSQAESDATELEGFPNNADARWARIRYFDQTGQEEEAIKELRGTTLNSNTDQDYFAFFWAIKLYRRGDYDEALEAFDRAHGRLKQLSQFIPAHIRMEADDRASLLREYRVGLDERLKNSSGVYVMFDWTVLRLLGDDSDNLEQVARKCHEGLRPLPGGQYFGEYMLGNMLPEKLLKSCGKSRRAQMSANYVIGIDMLARGERDRAKEYFKATRDTDCFLYYAYQLSQAFLERLEDEDSDWPAWIPVIADSEQ